MYLHNVCGTCHKWPQFFALPHPCPLLGCSVVPSHSEFGLSCMACFSQQDVSQYNTSNSLKTSCMVALPYSIPVPVLSEQPPPGSWRMTETWSRARSLWLPQLQCKKGARDQLFTLSLYFLLLLPTGSVFLGCVLGES